ncbi:hypothetical protein [uncultured Dokdonia sp.]|uniref:hypothetical protein n=1 Tax=uncultured Dokdonia sp. TaxID=575653 RepID=UPI00262A9A3E|nr:hypothetical protein [uncultured Dokdonia sp.]
MELINSFNNVDQFKLLNDRLFIFGENRMRIYKLQGDFDFVLHKDYEIPYSRFTINHLGTYLTWSGLYRFNLNKDEFEDQMAQPFTPTGLRYSNSEWLVYLEDEDLQYFCFNPNTQKVRKLNTFFSNSKPVFIQKDIVILRSVDSIYGQKENRIIWEYRLTHKSDYINILGEKTQGSITDIAVSDDFLYVLAGNTLVQLAISTGQVVWETREVSKFKNIQVIKGEILLTSNFDKFKWINSTSGEPLTNELVFDNIIFKDGTKVLAHPRRKPIVLSETIFAMINENGKNCVAQFSSKQGNLIDFVELDNNTCVEDFQFSKKRSFGLCVLRSNKLYQFR